MNPYKMLNMLAFKSVSCGAGEMALWLRTLAALSEDSSRQEIHGHACRQNTHEHKIKSC